MFKRNFNFLLLALALSAPLALRVSLPVSAEPLSQPAAIASVAKGSKVTNSNVQAERTNFSETIHGVKVADPYRWMENIDSDQTRAWIEAQRHKTEAYMSKVPNRQAIRRHLEKLQNYPRFGAPTYEAGKYFYYYNSGLQNQSVLYMSDSADSLGKPILDPNTFSQEGVSAFFN